jgi:hypothetical protein
MRFRQEVQELLYATTDLGLFNCRFPSHISPAGRDLRLLGEGGITAHELESIGALRIVPPKAWNSAGSPRAEENSLSPEVSEYPPSLAAATLE